MLRIAAASDLLDGSSVIFAERFQDQTGLEAHFILHRIGSARRANQGIGLSPTSSSPRTSQSSSTISGPVGFVQPASIHPLARGSLVLCSPPRVQQEQIARLADPDSSLAVKKIALVNLATALHGAAGCKPWSGRASGRRSIRKSSRPSRYASASVRPIRERRAWPGRPFWRIPLEIQLVEVEPSLYDPIVQALGVVTRSKRTGDAGTPSVMPVLGEGTTGPQRGRLRPILRGESEAVPLPKDKRTNALNNDGMSQLIGQFSTCLTTEISLSIRPL